MKWPKLMCLTRDDPDFSHLAQVQALCEAGARWIQLRCKELSDHELEPIAIECRKLCREAGCTFIVNDRLILALQIGADGVHLGKLDTPWDAARSLAGPGFLIGGTVNSLADAEKAVESGVLDYVGVGPFRFTPTKKNLAPVLSDEQWTNILGKLGGLPSYAIGGIRNTDMPKIESMNVTGAAISAAIFQETRVCENYRTLITAL